MACAGHGIEQEAALLLCVLPVADAPAWLRIFPGEPPQLRVMRQWLASLLGDSASGDDVALIAVELASNAIKHTASGKGGAFAVEVTRHQVIIRVAVADGEAAGEPVLLDQPEADSGRGLQLVRGLAIATGVRGDRQGRLVWADVLDRCLIPCPAGQGGPADGTAYGPGERALRQLLDEGII